MSQGDNYEKNTARRTIKRGGRQSLEQAGVAV